jgi:hypothetical protein
MYDRERETERRGYGGHGGFAMLTRIVCHRLPRLAIACHRLPWLAIACHGRLPVVRRQQPAVVCIAGRDGAGVGGRPWRLCAHAVGARRAAHGGVSPDQQQPRGGVHLYHPPATHATRLRHAHHCLGGLILVYTHSLHVCACICPLSLSACVCVLVCLWWARRRVGVSRRCSCSTLVRASRSLRPRCR